MKQFLEAGQIVRTHGVRGELVLDPWADSPQALLKVKDFYFDDSGARPAGLLARRVHKGRLLITLKGVDAVEQADRLRGRVLYANRDEIPLAQGSFFLQDLIGLTAVDGNTGAVYGVLEEVIGTPANDVYRIVKDGKEYLFPAVKHMIKRTDVEAGVIELLPIPGIFDGGGEEA